MTGVYIKLSIKIYHNNRCAKSRDALKLLQSEKNIDIEIVEYLKNGLSKAELLDLKKKVGLPIKDMMRVKEKEFSDYKNKELSEDDLIALMIKFPKLLERPIVINGNKAVIARPAEKILNIL